MKKVKTFHVAMPDGGELDNKINTFIESNGYELVDVKITSMVTVMESHILIATIIYKDRWDM